MIKFNVIRMPKQRIAAMLSLFLSVTVLWIGSSSPAQGASEANWKENPVGALAVERPVQTIQWAVKLGPGADPDDAASFAGFRNLGKIGPLEAFYLFEKLPAASLSPGFEHGGDEVAAAHQRLIATTGVLWAEQQTLTQMERLTEPVDPYYADQWHLKNVGQSGGTAGEDANIVPAWNAGWTGAGVTVAVVDDGLQHSHTDFVSKYVSEASWDFNDDDSDPSPGTWDPHGTSAAGVAVADDDGYKCGVGAAFGADVSGIRLIAGPISDADIANALTWKYQINDVYNNSWGPTSLLAAPGLLITEALAEGVANGRGGLGNVYVFAAGNDKQALSDVNYNGFANSRFTIAVGASDHDGVQSYYSEPGAALLVNAGSNDETVGTTTTDVIGSSGYNGVADSDCTNQFGGTSSASPLVAGVVALILEANPNLTWRDVQHILVKTAEQNDPGDDDWTSNGAGLLVNHKYGFGRVDGGAAVAAAEAWTTVGEVSEVSSGTIPVGELIPDDGSKAVSTFTVTEDVLLEHVEVIFNAQHPYRGDIRVVLTSPSGTQSVLSELHNDWGDDYSDWKFVSVRHWDEPTEGVWTLTAEDDYPLLDNGEFQSWELILHGKMGCISENTNACPAIADATWSVAEDAPVGTEVGAMSSSDPDGDVLSHVITTGNLGGAFTIDEISGQVKVSGDLDYETTSSFTLTVRVSDGEFSDGASVSIDIIDVPEFVLPTSETFIDVPVGHLFFGNVEWLAWADITKGCNPPYNNLICPDDLVTRGQMAAFLHRGMDGILTPSDPVQFIDDDDSIFEKDIEWLGATGVTRGCDNSGNTRFCPDDLVTRGQMAAFLTRALGLNPTDIDFFVDDNGSPFEDEINRLALSGITAGCGTGLFCPDDSVTRGQMAAFLHRALD